MISFTRQSNFQPKFVGVGCFLEVGGKILLLKRIEEKYEGGPNGDRQVAALKKARVLLRRLLVK